MKKFFKLVSTARKDEGWYVELDGKPVRTPSGSLLVIPVEPLAEEIAREWREQGEEIKPETMPLTQILVTALDRVSQERDSIQASVLRYFDTDLLCYRAEQPDTLVAREAAARDPWLGWFGRTFGETLSTTTGLMVLHHSEQAHAKVMHAVRDLDLWGFTVLQMVTAATGSLILALAFVTGPAHEDDLLRAVYVEENHKSDLYNEEFYGRAPQQEKAMQDVARDLKAGRIFLACFGLKKD